MEMGGEAGEGEHGFVSWGNRHVDVHMAAIYNAAWMLLHGGAVREAAALLDRMLAVRHTSRGNGVR